MIKRYSSILIILLFTYSTRASHISGGEIYYSLVSQSGNNLTYTITVKLLRDATTPSGVQLEPVQFVEIYEKGTNVLIRRDTVLMTFFGNLTLAQPSSCLINPPMVKYDIGLYEETVTLPASANGYFIVCQRCCRVGGIANIASSASASATYVAEIPGNAILTNAPANNSAHFLGIDTVIICAGYPFTYNFSASDPDADSLVYSFCYAYNRGIGASASAPPYSSVAYVSPYNGNEPMGSAVTIDQNTGIITGTAPPAGTYVVTVCVQEWRNGQLIAIQRKDLQVKTSDCDFPEVRLEPNGYTNCTNYTLSFANLNPSSAISSYLWDFGVTTSLADTSTIASPTFTYPDTGIYKLKVIVNRFQPCVDSAITEVRVFPGFAPDFDFTGSCILSPSQFNDLTTSAFGSVNQWHWNFGVTSLNNDSSILQDPQYFYSAAGNYNVQLIVGSSKGCLDTVMKTVTTIEKPLLDLAFRDTLICSVDTLQLQATGIGVISWTPGYNITNEASSTPSVFPKTTTVYTAELNDNGCINRDSLKVSVVDHVTIFAGNDTTICINDTAQLNAYTNGLHYSWSPNVTLSRTDILNPYAIPQARTTYLITAVIGGCSANDDITIKLSPRPFINAGNDTTICYRSSVQLIAQSNGTNFTWTPASSLNDATTLSPVADPLTTTRYILKVTDTISGCPKPSFDSLTVTVLPKLNVNISRDTIIFSGNQLQLFASGGISYSWSPATSLDDPFISNPTTVLYGNPDSVFYTVTVTNQKGCTDTAGVVVKVYKIAPEIFVPTGFTPNGDGKNDVFRPIYVGMQSIDYFQVYNRWGALIYSHNRNDGQGWDGTINGQKQNAGTFTWMVRATDIIGKVHVKKGTVVLIR